MHRLGCWKERLLYSVPALVCAISLMSFCVYLIAAVSFSIPLSPLGDWGRLRGMQNHCTDCCKKSEWIGVSVYVCVREWVPQGVCVFCFLVVFFFLFFFFWAYTNDWGQEFGVVAHMWDSIMHMTATRNHSGQTNRLQPLACAGLYTEVTS